MTEALDSLTGIAGQFGAIVLDQWGVLHDGSTPYPGVPDRLAALAAGGARLAVLSNSGKRAAPNAARITAMGFAPDLFDCVMTSGEALWQEIATGNVAARAVYPITRGPGDAEAWAEGLRLDLVDRIDAAEAVLLMGLPDEGPGEAHAILETARSRGLPVFCTNPDRASPRAGGAQVISPGALAHDLADAGGDVRFYGKPHAPVFRAVETALGLPPEKLLMIGDSLEHDIAGAAGAGWSTLFIRGGLHAEAFAAGRPVLPALSDLVTAHGTPSPTYTLDYVS